MSITHPAQILETTGGVNRTLGDKLGEIVSVRDYGAKGDGVTDDTTALQAALNAVQPGRRLWIPPGIYLYSAMLVLKNGTTVELVGDGGSNILALGGTVLRWNGAAGGTAFRLLNSYRTIIRRIRFDRVTNDPAIMVEIQEDNTQGDYDARNPSQLNRIEECTIKFGGIGVAVDLGAGSSDIMNDSHLFDHNVMDGQTVANVQLSGQNALNIGFLNNYLTGSPSAVQVANLGGGGGSFNWSGGYVASTAINFDVLATATEGVRISNCRSESSPRFLRVGPGGSVLSQPITLIGNFFSTASLNADGFAILATGAGPYTIVGCQWVGANQAKFSFTFGATTPVTVIGNAFETAGSDAATLVAGSGYRLEMAGNRYLTAGSVRVIKTDSTPTRTEPYQALTYTATIAAIDLTTASTFKLVATDASAFTFSNPVNPTHGQVFRIQIKNGFGAAISGTGPFSVGKWRAAAYTAPGAGKNRTYTFFYDSIADVYYEIRADADVGN